jgi:hypothetical protein
VFVDEYPFYAPPPPYAYGPAWRGGWDHRRFYGPW